MDIHGKRVLVTGADGFIGSHLTEALLKKGCKVRALSQYNSFNNWGWLEGLSNLKDVDVQCGDIRDPHFCHKLTQNIDVVFHLAALIAIPFSYVAPQSYVDTNVSGTLNICQASLDNDIERIVVTSTSEVYGTAQYVPINEQHPLQPQSPYSASKIAADAIALSFYNSFDLPLITARPFNTFGPRQSARAVIPSIISQVASGKKSIELGDMTPTRDFNFVEDVCQAFITLSCCDQALGKTVNIGSGKEISIQDLSILIQRLMGVEVSVEQDKQRLRPEKSEVFRLLCDNSLYTSLTNEHPKHSLKEGLQKTIYWFLDKENIKKYKTDIYNV
ncbi:NAD-dependent 4,6-dehydratase LegB [Kiloniella litopenaei]|uniref:NAD-dependent 4,6-dehydratase LegB n=1 Tax=Kiloniella litopenaei TaxID=1549748 RepID=UPI003BA98CDB